MLISERYPMGILNIPPKTDSEFFYDALQSWREDHPEFAEVPIGHMALQWLSQILTRAQHLKERSKL